MKNRKFALIGTSCIGKTTLLFELEQILIQTYQGRKIISVPEAARYYFETINTKKPFSYTNQRNIQNIAVDFEKKAEKQNPYIIICDRSALDAIAYVKAEGTEEEVNKLSRRVSQWLPTYSHFFLLDPKGVPYQTDEIRQETIATRELFHKSFLRVLTDLKLPYTLVSGSEKQRLIQMKEIISTFII